MRNGRAPLILAVAIQKGGTGKTNVVGNLGAELAALGRRVVVVDLDPQASLTTWLAGRLDVAGTADVLAGDATLAKGLMPVDAFGVQLLPSVPVRMRTVERSLANEIGAERRLAKALRGVVADVVLIDCPPSMSVLTASALVAATGVIIPVSTAPESLDGLAQFVGSVERLRDALDLAIPVAGVLPTRHDARLRVAREALDAIRSYAGESVTTAIVRENVALRELFGHRLPIRTYRPQSTGAADYAALASEVLTRA